MTRTGPLEAINEDSRQACFNSAFMILAEAIFHLSSLNCNKLKPVLYVGLLL